MDWAVDARHDLLDCLQDLRIAEAMLSRLPYGSRDHVLMAEAVARLSQAAYTAVRRSELAPEIH